LSSVLENYVLLVKLPVEHAFCFIQPDVGWIARGCKNTYLSATNDEMPVTKMRINGTKFIVGTEILIGAEVGAPLLYLSPDGTVIEASLSLLRNINDN
jgi:hypothetical protein